MSIENDRTRAISSDEIRQDIADTKAEIAAIEARYRLAEIQIRQRQEFIAKLEALLTERANSEPT